MKPLTFLSFFAGVGGFDLGFQDAGMECLGHVEIDPTCQRVLERHWPGKLKGTDVTKYLNAPPRNTKPDVICGGFPCQDLSVAGKRKGLAGERSGLWFAFRDIIAALKPRWVVIENVPGLLSSNEGRDFAVLLHGLGQLDYRFCSRVLDSQYIGVPQRRRRVFIVGSLGDGRSIEVLFEPESVCGDSPPSRTKRKGVAEGVASCLSASGRSGSTGESRGQDNVVAVAGTLGGSSQSGGFRTTDLDNSGAFIPDTCKTLTAEGADGMPDAEGRGYPIITGTLNPGAHPGSYNGQDAYNDQFVISPTVSSKWAKGSGGPAGDECQNLVLVARGSSAPERVAPALSTRPYADNDGQLDKLIPVTNMEVWKQTCGCGHEWTGRLDEPCPKCGEIREGMTHGDPIEPIPIQEIGKRQSGTSMNGVGHGKPGDPTLRAMSHHKSHQNGGGQVAVAFQESQTGCREYPEAGTLRANGPGHDPVGTRLRTTMGVRRLTPRECERLQGFPDDWTRWDAEGQEISDSARYRMIGNAVTAKVARWIGKQLMAAHDRKGLVDA
jgi:site-specific DNA-cytosine methylase